LVAVSVKSYLVKLAAFLNCNMNRSKIEALC